MTDIKSDGHGEKETQIYPTTINFPITDWLLPSNDSNNRLASTVKRLKENLETMTKYNDIVKDQVKMDIIQKIYDNAVKVEIKHYIPHYGVIKSNSCTTKLKVVYDASAKARKTNLSFNKSLYQGRLILENLRSLLLKFETANVTDIKKLSFKWTSKKWMETSQDSYDWKTSTNQSFQATLIYLDLLGSPLRLSPVHSSLLPQSFMIFNQKKDQ